MPDSSLRIAFLLEDTDPSDDVRTVLAYADGLIARGHRVRIVTRGSPVSWRSSQAEWIYVDDFGQFGAADEDFVAATFSGAHEAASRLVGERAIHIDISRIGPLVDDEVYRPATPRENEPMRVLLCGPSQAEERRIDDGYGAVAHARWFHQKLDLIRVSPWAPSREEPLDSVQEFHVALTTKEMTRLMHSCDVLIAPSFSLSAPEAMAAGIPTVLTSIPSYLSFDETHDYALFAPPANAIQLGEKLIEMLSDFDLREQIRARGREVAEQWRGGKVIERLETLFR